ncbi:armadillo-type protein [Lipomyces japonicus]|uniref:armadillo-type protein n=1 Tax=Lipomyces japonicus TaxID=56871 RepID=UPI0034CD89C7
MEDQVEQAVEIALNGSADSSLKQQAIAFCTQIKESDDGWQVCLSLFADNGRKRSPAVRFFALQVVDDALLKRLNQNGKFIEDSALAYIKDVLLSYVRREFSTDASEDVEISYIRNKLAQTITYFFLISYPNMWPSFFDDFISIANTSSASLGNIRGVDILLRIVLAIHEEIADTLIIRPTEVAKRNSIIKDNIRVRDMVKLANVWQQILVQYSSSEVGYTVIENCLIVIGSWVSWIDISLIVTPQYMSLIFAILGNERLRCSACDTLSEIISKKMKAADKLELISLLNLPQTIGQLQMGDDLEFAERVAKLSNVVSVELIKIMDEETSALTENAENILQQLMPFIIQFLANEYDDTSAEVFPTIADYLSFLRKLKKRNQNLTPARRQILSSILNTVILKIKYDESMEWHNDGNDDSENEFLEIRGRLRLFQDAVAAIDEDLFMDTISSVVIESLSGSKTNWREIEVGLFELGAYSDGLRNASAMPTKGGQGNARIIEILNSMLAKLTSSNILGFNHPSIHLQYMELIVKNSKFFETHTQLIPGMLEVFVSNVGVHSSVPQVQVRAWHLFYRFIKLLKGFLGDIAENALNAIGDLLVIKAEIAQANDNDSDNMSADGNDASSIFDSRLNLFEALGILVSVDAVSDEKQIHLVKGILRPIFENMEASLPRAPDDLQQALQVHHDIMAIGTFARGVTDGGKPITAIVREEFLIASRAILVTLQTLSKLEVIREASRFAFARMVPILGQQILPEIPILLGSLLQESTTPELGDFMAFVGQLLHIFKGQAGIAEMLDQLLSPLLNRVFYSLSISAEGSTDDEIQQYDMMKSYMNFMMGVLNNGMGLVLTSDLNRQMFDSVIQSVAHYSSRSQDASFKKMGGSIYTRLEEIRSNSV